jgi:hypothetical protein
LLLAVTTIPIYLTGEPAEELGENQPWFDERRVEALAALDGGHIRHDEIRPTVAMAAPPDSTST